MPRRDPSQPSCTRLGAQCAPGEPARRRCVDDLTFAAQETDSNPLPRHATPVPVSGRVQIS
eukprot:6871712-Prymnesium_polylepis.1